MPQRFSLLLDQYKLAPDVTRKRLWLETVQQVLSENRKVVGGDGRQLIYVPMPARERRQPPRRRAVLPCRSIGRAHRQRHRPARRRPTRSPRRPAARSRRDEISRWIPLAVAAAARAVRFGLHSSREGAERDRAQPGQGRAHRRRPRPAFQDARWSKATRVFDRRLQVLDAEPERYLTSDKQDISVDFFAIGRIAGRARVLSRHRRRRGSRGAAPGADHQERAAPARSIRARCSRWCRATARRSSHKQLDSDQLAARPRSACRSSTSASSASTCPRTATCSKSVYNQMRSQRQQVASQLRAEGVEQAQTDPRRGRPPAAGARRRSRARRAEAARRRRRQPRRSMPRLWPRSGVLRLPSQPGGLPQVVRRRQRGDRARPQRSVPALPAQRQVTMPILVGTVPGGGARGPVPVRRARRLETRAPSMHAPLSDRVPARRRLYFVRGLTSGFASSPSHGG